MITCRTRANKLRCSQAGKRVLFVYLWTRKRKVIEEIKPVKLIDQIIQYPDVVTPPNAQGEAQAWCPAHPDREGGKPSLGINVKKNGGRGIVKCFVCGFGGLRKLGDAWGLTPDAKARRLQIVNTYDYRDETGNLLYQVARAIDGNGEKTFRQRVPDPAQPDGWRWSLGSTRRVLYNLRAVIDAPAEEDIIIVEGEKDADNLNALGFVATTNSEGAGKWRNSYSEHFQDRNVVILRDNDNTGEKHINTVAASLSDAAATIKMPELQGLPPKGDVSDWLEAGHTGEELKQLIHATPAWQPTTNQATPANIFRESHKYKPVAADIISRLKTHGFFVKTVDGNLFFFDSSDGQKKLCQLGSFDATLLLNQTYEINKTEPLFNYLCAELEVEAAIRGTVVVPRQFAHYDPSINVMYLDTFDGRMLKLDGKTIKVQENGQDGVLFAPSPLAVPWKYAPSQHNLLETILIDSINFADDDSCPYSPQEQRLLMLCWILSIAFESVQPTKPLLLAVGPAGSGKSSMLRRTGKMFFGPEYEVDALRKDKEDDFWTKITTSPFATFDNVDSHIPWLPDALAQASTGIQVTKRKLYTTNETVKYTPRCFLSLTARTPTFRREDVASRLIILYLMRIEDKKAEYQLLEEVNSRRDTLMSEYAQMLNQVLASTPDLDADPNLRLADFANVAARIANAFHQDDAMRKIIKKLKRSQMTFATEENQIYLALDSWIGETVELDGQLLSNEGRRIYAKELLGELRETSDKSGFRFRIMSSNSLGIQIKNLRDELATHFNITNGHDRNGSWYEITRGGIERSG